MNAIDEARSRIDPADYSQIQAALRDGHVDFIVLVANDQDLAEVAAFFVEAKGPAVESAMVRRIAAGHFQLVGANHPPPLGPRDRVHCILAWPAYLVQKGGGG